MKKNLVIALVLIFLGSACVALPSKAVLFTPGVNKTATPGPVPAGQTPTSGGMVEPGATAMSLQCARVTADEALTVRVAASSEAQPVGWVLAGEVVRVTGALAGEWWPVAFNGRAGWVRSVYVERAECPMEGR